MIVNKDLIKEFKPCETRYRNYLTYYSEFNGSFEEFIDLENISYEDKIWLSKRVLNKNQLIKFGILCAESVQSIYNKKYLNNDRISNASSYLNTIIDFDDLSEDQLTKIKFLRKNAAVSTVATVAATYAAYAYAADAATAAAYAAVAVAYAIYAVYAVYAAKMNNRKIQENLNLSFLKQVSKL